MNWPIIVALLHCYMESVCNPESFWKDSSWIGISGKIMFFLGNRGDCWPYAAGAGPIFSGNILYLGICSLENYVCYFMAGRSKDISETAQLPLQLQTGKELHNNDTVQCQNNTFLRIKIKSWISTFSPFTFPRISCLSNLYFANVLFEVKSLNI